jgi:hypothetical protein
MSLTAPDSLLVPPALNARRRLHRRSSCSSIPRSVSACSSVWGFDSSEEVETYMAPLFRGLEGAHDEATEPVSATRPDDSNSSAKLPEYDSESLSDYHFDIAGEDHIGSEQPNPSATNANPATEPSPEPVRHDPPVIPKPTVSRPARQQSISSQAPPVPPRLRPPLVPAEAAKQDLPFTGTRPLRIDRSKKRQEQGGGPQRPSRTDALPYVRPSVRPIHRAATQANLREAYRRASPHSAKTAQTRHIPVARPPPLGPLPEIPGAKKVLTKHPLLVCRLLSFLFFAHYRWSLLLHYFRLTLSPWNMRKINSSMLTVWIDCRL